MLSDASVYLTARAAFEQFLITSLIVAIRHIESIEQSCKL